VGRIAPAGIAGYAGNKGFPQNNPWSDKGATIMVVDVERACYLDEYRIWLKFNTGESGVVDLRDLVFKYPAAEPLRNIEAFKQFYLDSWPTLAWECGFDVAPEALYERATGKCHAWGQQPQPNA
jgi:hypothetical protein